MTIRKITFYPGCYNESTRYRVYNIIEGLTYKGIFCEIIYTLTEQNVFKSLDSDIIVIFRSDDTEETNYLINQAKQANIPVVFDIDDLIFDTQIVDSIDAFSSLSQEEYNQNINRVKGMNKVIKQCDCATTTTSYLASKVENLGIKTFIIPNTINIGQRQTAEMFANLNNANNDILKIGYFSGTKTHEKDFDQAQNALTKILNKYPNVQLHIIGELDITNRFKGLENQVVKHPFMPYIKMIVYLSRTDINIAPLELNNPFNEGKSELKIFESAMLGVPTVASAVNSYSNCITDGVNGMLAHTEDEWFNKLSSLIEDQNLRNSLAENAYNNIFKRFYIVDNIDNIIDTYNTISDLHTNKNQRKVNGYQVPKISEAFKEYFGQNTFDYDIVSVLNNPLFPIDNILNDEEVQNKIISFANNNSDKIICFYGAGLLAEEFAKTEPAREFKNVMGFIDNNKEKAGSKLGRHKVYHSEEIKNLKPDIIILTLLQPKYAMSFLENYKQENNLSFEIAADLFQ